ncbi:Cell cycle checkpoint protein rad17 [Quaeritorhiza haematococci]|nr:Cell cycle checkpoint protein rad17 [Quaeritorhiza haematococci]
MDTEAFVFFLHQNYLTFYADVDELVGATQYLSDADMLMGARGAWEHQHQLKPYAVSVATRGLLFTHTEPVPPQKFRHLYRPQLWKAQRECRELAETVRGVVGVEGQWVTRWMERDPTKEGGQEESAKNRDGWPAFGSQPRGAGSTWLGRGGMTPASASTITNPGASSSAGFMSSYQQRPTNRPFNNGPTTSFSNTSFSTLPHQQQKSNEMALSHHYTQSSLMMEVLPYLATMVRSANNGNNKSNNNFRGGGTSSGWSNDSRSTEGRGWGGGNRNSNYGNYFNHYSNNANSNVGGYGSAYGGGNRGFGGYRAGGNNGFATGSTGPGPGVAVPSIAPHHLQMLQTLSNYTRCPTHAGYGPSSTQNHFQQQRFASQSQQDIVREKDVDVEVEYLEDTEEADVGVPLPSSLPLGMSGVDKAQVADDSQLQISGQNVIGNGLRGWEAQGIDRLEEDIEEFPE